MQNFWLPAHEKPRSTQVKLHANVTATMYAVWKDGNLDLSASAYLSFFVHTLNNTGQGKNASQFQEPTKSFVVCDLIVDSNVS